MGQKDAKYAVQCVKHDHRPTQNTKFLGEPQIYIQKKLEFINDI